MKKGIILQGRISDWTKDIILEYEKNFPNAEIILSTWENENVENIKCKTVLIEPPNSTKPFNLTINHQIFGTRAGLRESNSDLILKCRTDQFIHNTEIFEIFSNSCSPNKIMIPDHGTYQNIEFRASDLCQIGMKNVLCDYWDNMPIFDGSTYSEPGYYLTKNYIQKIKNDTRTWNTTLNEYFCVKSYELDFQIEFEKLNKFKEYQDTFYRAFLDRVKID